MKRDRRRPGALTVVATIGMLVGLYAAGVGAATPVQAASSVTKIVGPGCPYRSFTFDNPGNTGWGADWGAYCGPSYVTFPNGSQPYSVIDYTANAGSNYGFNSVNIYIDVPCSDANYPYAHYQVWGGGDRYGSGSPLRDFTLYQPNLCGFVYVGTYHGFDAGGYTVRIDDRGPWVRPSGSSWCRSYIGPCIGAGDVKFVFYP
jgi:hypothetical protein